MTFDNNLPRLLPAANQPPWLAGFDSPSAAPLRPSPPPVASENKLLDHQEERKNDESASEGERGGRERPELFGMSALFAERRLRLWSWREEV